MKAFTLKGTFSDRAVFRLLLVGIAILQAPNALTLVGAVAESESLIALGRVGSNKQIYLNVICLVLALALSTSVLRSSGQPSWPKRIGLCLVIWAVLATFSVNFRHARFYQERQHDTLKSLAIASERLIVRELGVIRGLDGLSRNIKEGTANSFEALHEMIRSQKSLAVGALDGLPKEAIDVAFYMATVSRIWAFGNEKESSKVGCVLQNELTGFQAEAFSGLSHYLGRPIGCCTDYAFVLKRLLELEGLENRLVQTPGHVFNEVFIGGKWWVVDPTLNLLTPHSWSSLMSERAPYAVEIYLLPHWSLAAGSSAPRPKVGAFRQHWLNLIALGRDSEFIYLNQVPASAFGGL